jgi:hypothetical protein
VSQASHPTTASGLVLVYDYLTQLCRRQAEIIHNHGNENVCNIEQGETLHRKYKKLKLGGGDVYDRSSVLEFHGIVQPFKGLRMPWQLGLLLVGHKLLY